ncbi:LPS O-antigen chain length determinant protein WzzB [Pseudomonas sp. Marseille-P9899]|uniref:LPS O-antigen chain length determinant protein WzzB n=1 Tax=Pseudomonas sp. Marseille-P9899 TaxID=2730401 RepID=UPI00158D9C1A|nr:Wzz/FepE/Etk N-terminal domain-containing protein [Pseudomonas sp. Marseille-P9899]
MHNDYERSRNNDEVDLVELLAVVLRERFLIITLVILAALGSTIYVLLAAPVYEAKAVVGPPTQSDISQLNYGRGGTSDLALLKVKDVYDVYVSALQSESLRQKFFREVYLPSLSGDDRSGGQDDLYRRFNELLTVQVDRKEPSLRFAITVRLSDPQTVTRWVVLYAQMAGALAKQDVLEDIKGDAAMKASHLQQQISSAQDSARRLREDQITQLQEALRVAKSIGLEDPPIISNSMSVEVSAGMEGALTYMRGSKALEAEIDNLQKRPSDDPFIDGLREKQVAMAVYRALEVDPSAVRVYRQDGDLDIPDGSVKPRKVLIVLLSTLFGAGAGVFFVLARHFWRGVRSRYSSV